MSEKSIHKVPFLPSEHWFWKSGKAFMQDPLGFLLHNRQNYGDIYFFSAIRLKIGILSHPDYVKHVLQDNNKNYVKSIAYQRILKKFLGNGLLTSEGDFWRRQRRIAQPAFHRDRLAEFTDLMVSCTEDMIVRWKKNPAFSDEINMSDEMMSLTSEVVAKALFNKDLAMDTRRTGQSINRLNELGTMRLQKPWYPPLWVPLPHNLAFRRNKKNLDKLIYEAIDRRKKQPDPGTDLLGMLLSARDAETGEGMTDLQLRDELMTLFVAGHETSATTLSWIFYLLHQNPEKKAILLQEIRTHLGQRSISLQDLPALPYTLQVIYESMRLYPAAWMIGRRATTPDHIAGFKIEADRNMLIPIYIIHRHPDLWENPDEFIPERFEKEKAKTYDKFAYFPFGGGPRLCIGNNFALMEMQIILATILRDFDFVMKDEQPIAPEALITLKPSRPVLGRLLPA